MIRYRGSGFELEFILDHWTTVLPLEIVVGDGFFVLSFNVSGEPEHSTTRTESCAVG